MKSSKQYAVVRIEDSTGSTLFFREPVGKVYSIAIGFTLRSVSVSDHAFLYEAFDLSERDVLALDGFPDVRFEQLGWFSLCDDGPIPTNPVPTTTYPNGLPSFIEDYGDVENIGNVSFPAGEFPVFRAVEICPVTMGIIDDSPEVTKRLLSDLSGKPDTRYNLVRQATYVANINNPAGVGSATYARLLAFSSYTVELQDSMKANPTDQDLGTTPVLVFSTFHNLLQTMLAGMRTIGTVIALSDSGTQPATRPDEEAAPRDWEDVCG